MPSSAPTPFTATNRPHSFSNRVFSTDSYVTATLGGHSNLVDHGEDHHASDPVVSNTNSSTGGGSNNASGINKVYTAKTRLMRRSLNPVFDEEFRFEIANDTLLQDEPLIFKVWGVDSGVSAALLSNDGCIGIV